MDMKVAMKKWTRGTELIFAREFNVDLGRIEGQSQYKKIVGVISTADMEDLLGHLLLQRRKWCRDRRTWEMVQQVRVVRSWTDYILGSISLISRNVACQDHLSRSTSYVALESQNVIQSRRAHF